MTCENQISKLDAWAASSLLQKAIRRGDDISACAAAETLYRWRGARIWNRLQLIAIEDVGIADIDLVSDFKDQIEKLDAQTSSSGFKEILPWVQRLSEAAKDRSADYLICVANSHPDFESDRVGLRFFPPTDLVATALDPGQPASRRAVAAWYASGVPSGRPVPMPEGNLSLLLSSFVEAGMPEGFAAAIRLAIRKTREPICTMMPLLWHLRNEHAVSHTAKVSAPPFGSTWRGIPLYSYDKHTRLGKVAIARFSRECLAVRSVINKFVPQRHIRKVIEMAAFYADAIPLQNRLDWALSHSLHVLGREADFLKVGCPREGITQIMEAVQDNLTMLNEIRADLLQSTWAGGW